MDLGDKWTNEQNKRHTLWAGYTLRLWMFTVQFMVTRAALIACLPVQAHQSSLGGVVFVIARDILQHVFVHVFPILVHR